MTRNRARIRWTFICSDLQVRARSSTRASPSARMGAERPSLDWDVPVSRARPIAGADSPPTCATHGLVGPNRSTILRLRDHAEFVENAAPSTRPSPVAPPRRTAGRSIPGARYRPTISAVMKPALAAPPAGGCSKHSTVRTPIDRHAQRTRRRRARTTRRGCRRRAAHRRRRARVAQRVPEHAARRCDAHAPDQERQPLPSPAAAPDAPRPGRPWRESPGARLSSACLNAEPESRVVISR